MTGTLNVEKAKVDGVGVTEKDKSALDALLEKVDLERAEDEGSFRIIDAELSSEIVGTLRGHFTKKLIYNIPRRSERGKKSHRECDLMEGGCPYKDKNPHIHILGVGIQGALTAMRAYGRMRAIVPEMPEIVEQGDRLYWAAYAVATDRHTGNEYGRWYLEPVMRKAGQRSIENEFAASISESKALRNVMLALIPSGLMDSWLEDYRAGKRAFSERTAKAMGYGSEAQREKPEAKANPKRKSDNPKRKTPGERDLEGVIEELAEKMGVDSDELSSWSAGYYGTPGKAMLQINRAANGEEHDFDIVVNKFGEWKSSQADRKPEGEAEEPENEISGEVTDPEEPSQEEMDAWADEQYRKAQAESGHEGPPESEAQTTQEDEQEKVDPVLRKQYQDMVSGLFRKPRNLEAWQKIVTGEPKMSKWDSNQYQKAISCLPELRANRAKYINGMDESDLMTRDRLMSEYMQELKRVFETPQDLVGFQKDATGYGSMQDFGVKDLQIALILLRTLKTERAKQNTPELDITDEGTPVQAGEKQPPDDTGDLFMSKEAYQKMRGLVVQFPQYKNLGTINFRHKVNELIGYYPKRMALMNPEQGEIVIAHLEETLMEKLHPFSDKEKERIREEKEAAIESAAHGLNVSSPVAE